MLRHTMLRVVAFFLIVVMPLATVAQSQGGMLTATAGVSVNGKAAPADVDTAMLPGDKIQTGAGTAQIRLEGSLLQLGPNTELVLGAVPELGCGQLAYFSTKGPALRVGAAEIKPASSGEAKFDVVHAAGTITAAVMVGSVVFQHNGQTTTLRSGESTTLADDANCPAIATTAAPAPENGVLHNGKVIAILAGGGAGAAVAAIVATRQKEPVSPSRP